MLVSGEMAMGAQVTLFEGEVIEPVPEYSGSWETNLRPDFPPSKPVAKLKDLHLQTDVVVDGKPACTILVPEGRYAESADRIRAAVRARTGGLLPIRTIAECPDPESELRNGHVITFGNMATNPFLFRLYCRWLTVLDLKWPGPGGHALLSLHNPFGTGYNAILVGGSDDAGVAESAERFAARIEEGGELGWLHDVRLGQGLVPPDLTKDEEVLWWAGAPGHTGRIGTWARAVCFGWNSIATCACLYYMTGDETYAQRFKRLAMSRPGHVPDEIRKDYSYWNPANPLVETYHYYSHLIPYLWDLIEESPVFSDEERLYITNKLVEQQDHYDPDDNFGTPNGSRHCSYQMLNIYTGSLYFSKYYPERRWFQRLANIRGAFDAWHDNCTWGELDLIYWLPTSEEFVLNFFLLDDSWEAFAADGSAAEMIGPQLHCWTGHTKEPVNALQALSMMHKATWMTRDPGWAWLARQADYKEGVFRVGQSWWPAPELAPAPPDWALNRVSVVSLQKSDWKQAHRAIPLEQGAQFAVYRNTLDESGDCVRLDMAWFCARNPYHLATPDYLRVDGNVLINGGGANAVLRRDGLVETGRTPRIAALTARPALAEGTVMAAFVPNASHGMWTRILMHRTGRRTIVLDRVAPKESGNFELSVNWPLGGGIPMQASSGDAVRSRTGCAEILTLGADGVTRDGNLVKAVTARDCRAGEALTQISILMPRTGTSRSWVRSISETVHILNDEACILSGDISVDDLAFQGTAACIEPTFISLVDTSEFRVGGTSLSADRPVSLVWALEHGTCSATVHEDTRVSVNGELVQLAKGTHEVPLACPEASSNRIRAFLAEQAGTATDSTEKDDVPGKVFLDGAKWVKTPDGPVLRINESGAHAIVGPGLDASHPFSLEAWVAPDAIGEKGEGERRAIVSQWQVSRDQRSFMLLLDAGVPAFWISEDGTWDAVHPVAADGSLIPGWHHIGTTWDGNTARLFVDGKPAAYAPLPCVHRSSADILLGRYPNGYAYFGDMCGVRIYDRALSVAEFAAHFAAGRSGMIPEDAALVFSLEPPPVLPVSDIRGDWEPLWRGQVPGRVLFLEVTADGQTIWAGCANRTVAMVENGGGVRNTVELPAPITSFALAPGKPASGTLAAVVGLDDDQVVGLDDKGNILWREKAEVHPKFWLDGHWRAPWFTDPATCHGVLDVLFMDWKDGTPMELVLGRACTVEFRNLDGTLLERVPLEWGDRATLGIGQGAEGKPVLTASTLRRSLGANTQIIDRAHRGRGSAYLALPADYTRISGQGQGFRFPRLVDLDGDGTMEYVCALAGSWNDLICYDAATQEPRWVRALGTGPRDGSFLVGMEVTPSVADGRRGVVAAAANGWVWRFDCEGKLVWALRMPDVCSDMSLMFSSIAVGLKDGTVQELTGEGTKGRRAVLGNAVAKLAMYGDGVLAATDQGELVFFPAMKP